MLQRVANFGWHRRRPHRFSVDEDMHEMSGRGRLVRAGGEDRDLVPDAAVAELADPQAGLDDLGKGQRADEPTHARRDHADHLAGGEIEPARADQILVHHRIEVGIVGRVVDVAIDVVIHPARLNGQEMAVTRARFGGFVGHAGTGASGGAFRCSACPGRPQSRLPGGRADFRENKIRTKKWAAV